jgi:hypothetical protein
MLSTKPERRPTAAQLLSSITVYGMKRLDTSMSSMFGQCCKGNLVPLTVHAATIARLHYFMAKERDKLAREEALRRLDRYHYKRMIKKQEAEFAETRRDLIQQSRELKMELARCEHVHEKALMHPRETMEEQRKHFGQLRRSTVYSTSASSLDQAASRNGGSMNSVAAQRPDYPSYARSRVATSHEVKGSAADVLINLGDLRVLERSEEPEERRHRKHRSGAHTASHEKKKPDQTGSMRILSMTREGQTKPTLRSRIAAGLKRS